MKKIIVIMLCACVLMSSFSFSAEVDLTAMSLEELVSLRTDIEAEILNRMNSEISPIAEGFFVVGKTIKAGTYYISGAHLTDNYFIIYLYENEEAFNAGEPMYGAYGKTVLKEGGEATVTLSDGMVMEIEGGSAMIQEYKPSFMPAG